MSFYQHADRLSILWTNLLSLTSLMSQSILVPPRGTLSASLAPWLRLLSSRSSQPDVYGFKNVFLTETPGRAHKRQDNGRHHHLFNS